MDHFLSRDLLAQPKTEGGTDSVVTLSNDIGLDLYHKGGKRPKQSLSQFNNHMDLKELFGIMIVIIGSLIFHQGCLFAIRNLVRIDFTKHY